MLTQEEIEKFTVTKKDKIEALLNVIHKLGDIRADLYTAIFDKMPFSANDEWQDEADKVFWHTEGMDKLLAIDNMLRTTRELAVAGMQELEAR